MDWTLAASYRAHGPDNIYKFYYHTVLTLNYICRTKVQTQLTKIVNSLSVTLRPSYLCRFIHPRMAGQPQALVPPYATIVPQHQPTPPHTSTHSNTTTHRRTQAHTATQPHTAAHKHTQHTVAHCGTQQHIAISIKQTVPTQQQH